jgi:hypothetical protein
VNASDLELRTPRLVRPAMIAVSLLLLAAGCAGDQLSTIAQEYGYGDSDRGKTPPIVIVAGFLGSVLEDPDSGHVVWGEFFSGEIAMSHADVQQRFSLPMTGGDSLATLRDGVVATRIFDLAEVKLGPKRITVNAYPGLMTGLLGGVGSESGDVTPSDRELRSGSRSKPLSKGEIDALIPVHYDWRRDIAEATYALEEAIGRAHALKLEMGLEGDAARVDVITHSQGTALLRYYLRYGTQQLPANGSLPVLDWRGAGKVRRALLVGPPNAGSTESLMFLAHGGRPESMLPKTPAGVLGSLVSMYQLMPHADQDTVISASDGAVIDLFDVDNWDRLGWGPLGHDDDAKSVRANLMPELSTDTERRAAAKKYVALCLANTRQFHAALDIPSSPPPGTTLHLFASDTEPTEHSIVVDTDSGEIEQVNEVLGDGTVTRVSALRVMKKAGGRVETPINWSTVHFIRGDHLGMVADPGFIDNALYLLLQAPIAPPAPRQ